jgi:hypothetical protein
MNRMETIGKSRVVLAILAIAFLLFNPAGVCAGTPSSSSPSHPCCPNPTPQKDAAPASCICIDRQPAAPTLPSLADAGPAIVAAAAPVAAIELPRPEAAAAFDVPIAAPQDRSVSFHQLLL